MTSAGWYPDPLGEGTLRWHDGSEWTDHVSVQEAVRSAGAEGSVEHAQVAPFEETVARAILPPDPEPRSAALNPLLSDLVDRMVAPPQESLPVAGAATEPGADLSPEQDSDGTDQALDYPAPVGAPVSLAPPALSGTALGFPPPTGPPVAVPPAVATPVPAGAAPVGPGRSVDLAVPPEELVAYLARELVGAGAIITSQSTSGLTGQVITKQKPSLGKALLLWLLCVIPAILYLINGSKDVTEPFSLTLVAVPGGTRVEPAGTGRGLAATTWVLGQAAAHWPMLPTAG